MWFLAEKGGSYNPSAMHNLKTRIKRGKNSPKKGSTEECVDDWQFVNFNPFFYGANNSPANGAGNRRSLAYGEVLSSSTDQIGASSTSATATEAPAFISGGREDFYEFPTSTKLNIKRNSHEEILQQKVKDDVNLLKNLQRRSLQNVPCDLLPPYQTEQIGSGVEEHVQRPQGSPPRPQLPLPHVPLPPPPSLKKSNSVLSTSSSSSLSTNPSPSNSNPVSRSSSRGKDEGSSRSTFYVPPALPPKGGRLRTSALSLLQSPPETQKKTKKGKPPPPPPIGDPHFGDLIGLQDFLDSCNASSSPPPFPVFGKKGPPPAPPPLPPPYPREGLGRLITSNNLSTVSRPLSWDLNLKAGTVTLIEDRDLGGSNDGESNKKAKRPSFYNVHLNHLNGRKSKEKEKLPSPPVPVLINSNNNGAKTPDKERPTLLSSSPTSSGPPLPLKPRKLNGHGHNNLPHISALIPQQNKGNVNLQSGVANLCLNLSTISEKPLGGSGSSLKGDRRPDTLSEERIAPDGLTFEDDVERVTSEPKKPSTAVGRSESCKERVQRKQTRERRKHSDPNLTSKSSDADLDNQRQLSDANNSGSSSNSSLSARYLTSLESPSTSLELIAPSNNSSSSLRERSSETPETTVGHSSEPYKPSPGWCDGDSDIEIEQDPPDWMKNVPEETLAALDRLEKKRQEVLNELFHTERSHVRNLKVVDRLFHRPIRQQNLLPEHLVNMLFANLEEILDMHGRLNSAFKKLRKESVLVGDIGHVLLEMFDGASGDSFKKAAATFCAKQQIGLEILRDKRRKDARFHSFLNESESDAVCRRLGIKDMIPMAMQRLTKYPLLFENLCNCTSPDTEEYKNIHRAVELSKEILCHVNYAKKEAEDQERLIEIQKKLDKSAFDKGIDKTDTSISEIRNLDFTKHHLIYEGSLMWRMTKSRGQKSDLQDVQAILLNDMIVILLKQDDRYVLKIHNMGFPGKSDRMMAKPIIKLNNLHHRPVATDKKAFFLISTTSSNMYELVCSTAEERNVWFHHITKAADDYKNRQESRRSENMQNVTSTNNIPPSLSSDVQDDKGKDLGAENLTGADAEGDKDSAGLLIPPTATPSLSKEPSPAPESSFNDASQSPASPDKSGDGRLSVGTKVGRSPSTVSRKGEFLQITQSSPLVDPSEIVVTSREVHYAQPVLSPYEELKRADALVQKALEEKLRIASNLFHIPPSPSKEESNSINSKDAKELIVTCISNVDRLIGIVSSQKSSKDNAESQKEQQSIHASLNQMLTHILSEFERKEEELEIRRQEFCRVREQNHGYQERLQTLTVSSPPHSRPSSLLSDHQHNDDPEIAKILHSKPLSSDPVVTSVSSEEDVTTSDLTVKSCDSAQNIADTTNKLNSEDSEVESEKNRDCPETEVVIVTTESTTEPASAELIQESSPSPVPEPITKEGKTNGELLEPSVLKTNGHNGSCESTSDSDQVDEEQLKSHKKLEISSTASPVENKVEKAT